MRAGSALADLRKRPISAGRGRVERDKRHRRQQLLTAGATMLAKRIGIRTDAASASRPLHFLLADLFVPVSLPWIPSDLLSTS